MPHRLRRRNPKEMFGLRGLSGADLEKARAGNRQVKHAIRTVKQCLCQQTSGYLENPVGSMVWYLLDRALSKEFKSGKLHYVVFVSIRNQMEKAYKTSTFRTSGQACPAKSMPAAARSL